MFEGTGSPITLVDSGFVGLDIALVSSTSMSTVHETIDGFRRLALVFF